MKVRGNVFKYGDNVDTDVIIPARYLSTADPKSENTVWKTWARILPRR